MERHDEHCLAILFMYKGSETQSTQLCLEQEVIRLRKYVHFSS
uniref:Uncharacterized protein n=1 Tax=Arundo donax TaxID=35708 RepID=A0A0A9FND7_ARUDO